MYASALQSDWFFPVQDIQSESTTSHSPHYVRARGVIELESARREELNVRGFVREEGSLRIRFPREGGEALVGVIVNTGGGMTGGDEFSIAARVAENTCVTLTTSAAEKFYRSTGEMAVMNIALSVERNSSLFYVPQEAIVFNQARVQRSVDVRLAGNARALLCDMTCIGRTAMDEKVENIVLRDKWRIWVDDKLEIADFTTLSGDGARILARPNIADGAVCFGTLYLSGDHLNETVAGWNQSFATLPEGTQAAAGVAGKLALVRMVSSNAQVLRSAMSTCFAFAGLANPPRSWAT